MSSGLDVAVVLLSAVAGTTSALVVLLTKRALHARDRSEEEAVARIMKLTSQARSIKLVAVDKNGASHIIAKRQGPISVTEAEEIQRGVHAGRLHSG